MNCMILNAALRRDPYVFIKYVFLELFPGETFEDGPHIQAIAWQIGRIISGEETRLVVNLPPRSLKSFCFSVVLVALYLGHYPERRVVCVSYSEELAAVLSRMCKKLMQSDRYRAVFPGTVISKTKNTETEFETTAGGGRLAVAMGGSITGRGADLMIIDDPAKPEDMKSPTERQRIRDIMEGTLYSRLNSKEKGAIVLVMQRLHADDPTAHLLEKGRCTHLMFKAIATEDEDIPVSGFRAVRRPAGTALLPGRESVQTLERLKRDMGSLHFEAQYQQSPVLQTGAVFQREWFREVSQTALPTRDAFERVIISWDPANMPGQGHDYSAGTVWGVYKGYYYLLEVIRIRVKYPALKKRVISAHQSWPNATTLIEHAGNGLSLLQDLKSTTITAVAYKPKIDKETRAQQATGPFEAGKVILPADASWKAEYMSELLGFPNCRHDDLVDSTTQFLNWVSISIRRDPNESVIAGAQLIGSPEPSLWQTPPLW